MKVLVALSSPEYLRFFDDTIVELARRGHDVALGVDTIRDRKPVRLDAIQEADPRISFAGLIPPRDDRWVALARAVRGTMDFVRYWHPDLAPAALLRARVKRQALPWVLQWLDRIRSLPPAVVRRAMAALAAVERAIPPSRAHLRFIEAQAPDLVLVSPLVEPASDQVDLVRAAQARGVRVGALVASWDNLTNKGDLRVPTDMVAVWNGAQKREAIEYHRVRPERVVVTGAQPFDRWFDRGVTRARDEFCRAVGLPGDGPFLLFTGSSIFIARAEAEMPFVRQWIEALRASDDPRVRGLAVLVRPHPYNGRKWDPSAFADMPGVAVWPRGGYDPTDEGNRADFFDSLSHSEAVIGINTSAMIEAAIVGRPVLSIAAPQFAGTQEGTLHYRHLLPENGGFLRVAATLDEHVAQLSAILRDPDPARDELERFVGSFVRPHGLARRAVPLLADAIERCGLGEASSARMTTSTADLTRFLLLPLAIAARLCPSPAERDRRIRERRHRTSEARVAAVAAASIRSSRKLDRLNPARGVRFAVLGPPLAGLLLVVGFCLSETLGYTAVPPPANIAEAAGIDSGAEVLRFLRQGQDPSEVLAVRPDIVSSSITRATALETAMWSRELPLVRLLDREFGIDDVTRSHLACVAADISAPEIARYLAPSGAACVPGHAVHLIEARAR